MLGNIRNDQTSDFSVVIFSIKAWSHYTDLDGLTGYVGISEPKDINGITNILLNDPSV